MNLFIYIIIGIIGALCGSVCTLAVYRLPRGEDITHKRSYCPKCGHRLNFLDLIPVLSYIFLKGKCRYCKEPIHPRYILFELFTSLIFILLAFSMNISFYSDLSKFILLFYNILIITVLMIVGLIDKEGNDINLGTIIFGYIITCIYTTVFDGFKAITYFLVYVYVLILNLVMRIFNKNITKKDFTKTMYCGYIVFIFGIKGAILIFLLTLIYSLINRYLLKRKVFNYYYISVFSIILLMLNNISCINSLLKF